MKRRLDGRLAFVAALLCTGVFALGLFAQGQRKAAAPRQDLQGAVTRAMAGRSGAVVVLEVASGRVLAAHRLDVAARTLAAPGSSIKPFTLLALLESGKLSPETRLLCKRALRIGDYHPDCTHAVIDEPMRARTALAYSCNFYFAEFAARLDDADLVRTFARWGLTSPSGLAERAATGAVRRPRTLEQRQLLALGLEGIEVTPLELLAAYRKLALRRRDGETNPALAAVFDGLEASTAYGMGQLAKPEGLEVAGKTGTSVAAGGGWSHAWFAGYAPARAPEIVVVVFLQRGRGGPDAAPVAREIFAAYAASRGRP